MNLSRAIKIYRIYKCVCTYKMIYRIDKDLCELMLPDRGYRSRVVNDGDRLEVIAIASGG